MPVLRVRTAGLGGETDRSVSAGRHIHERLGRNRVVRRRRGNLGIWGVYGNWGRNTDTEWPLCLLSLRLALDGGRYEARSVGRMLGSVLVWEHEGWHAYRETLRKEGSLSTYFCQRRSTEITRYKCPSRPRDAPPRRQFSKTHPVVTSGGMYVSACYFLYLVLSPSPAKVMLEKNFWKHHGRVSDADADASFQHPSNLTKCRNLSQALCTDSIWQMLACIWRSILV
ncbi:hypothetical protein GE09DRAFT_334428 [Coniochaeta sp. 2T2.1]|nr:hypothetical protein GE09DRAFT_334428 [Coniochaeta sp. 2T2.1]